MTYELNYTFVKCIFKYLVFQQVQYDLFLLLHMALPGMVFYSYFLDFQLTEQAKGGFHMYLSKSAYSNQF